MVGKTRLFQHTGSPLIQGMSRRRGSSRVIIAVVLLVVVSAVIVYLVYLR